MAGRNDPCPCGSGKKYKHCCLGKEDDKTRPGPAQAIADAIAEAAAEQPFSSLEELNTFTAQVMDQQNQWAMAEFCGLSPEQISRLLYAPFTSPETVRFSTDIEPAPDTGIMRLFMALVEAIGESGLKATAKGNLPLKFCKALAQRLREEDEDTRRLRIGGIRSEEDLDELHCTRLIAVLAGLIRKYRGKFVLTRKCRWKSELFPETTYTTTGDGARHCYFLRALERFAAFFGLAELTLESQELYRYRYLIRKSAQLDRFVTFKL